jgi:hypothetical protein
VSSSNFLGLALKLQREIVAFDTLYFLKRVDHAKVVIRLNIGMAMRQSLITNSILFLSLKEAFDVNV